MAAACGPDGRGRAEQSSGGPHTGQGQRSDGRSSCSEAAAGLWNQAMSAAAGTACGVMGWHGTEWWRGDSSTEWQGKNDFEQWEKRGMVPPACHFWGNSQPIKNSTAIEMSWQEFTMAVWCIHERLTNPVYLKPGQNEKKMLKKKKILEFIFSRDVRLHNSCTCSNKGLQWITMAWLCCPSVEYRSVRNLERTFRKSWQFSKFLKNPIVRIKKIFVKWLLSAFSSKQSIKEYKDTVNNVEETSSSQS